MVLSVLELAGMRLIAILGVCITACGGESGLDAAERALLIDGLESVDAEGNIVDQVEVTLSGTVDPALSADAAAADSALAAEARLTPSTCIDSTVQGNVVTHVLVGCTGPRGRMLSGTVVSTWTADGACLHVEHATTDFTIAGRAATGTLGVTICRSGSTETRTRALAFTATTRRDEPLSLTASWDVSLDTVTGCATQSGTVTGQIGDRAIDRDDTGFLWCATPTKPAPLAEAESLDGLRGGTMLLGTDLNDDTQLRLTVELLGDRKIRITTSDGIVSDSDMDSI
jgi:hypothetical protein